MVFWVLATWVIFTYVGEKMAWHTVYFATSMGMLGGWWLGKLITGIDWKTARSQGVFWLMAMAPLFLIAVRAILPTSTRRPFVDMTVTGLSTSLQWVLALVFGLVLLYFIYDRISALGWAQGLRAITLSLVALLGVWTVVVSYRFSYINYDYATEPMVYAHATPDIKLALGQLEEISRKTVGDHQLKFSYDDDSTWPLEWYFRDYPNKVYYGANPSRDAMDVPVVFVGDKNLSKVRPYLGDRYEEFDYRLVWWPKEEYKGASLQRILNGLKNPTTRGEFWDIVLHRRYKDPTSEWDPAHRFSMFVRKDVAAQVWDWGVPAAAAASEGSQASAYEAGMRDIAATQQLGAIGAAGAEPGQFNFPRAVALDAQGRTYVADSGNNRVQVFNPDGSFLRQWGSTCRLDSGEGCIGDGRGQFNEPWGIAVGPDGSVYVSDTWNGRVQKFDDQGNFVAMYGQFGSTNGELGEPSFFYGPRAVVVGQDGNLHIMDTGNKRVVVLSPDLEFVNQYGGGGVTEGRFDEPVGLAQDGEGNWYVADTWNRRIQKFDPAFNYLAQWPIEGWGSQSVLNKPGIAVDPQRRIVYAVDPENYRVLAFDTEGNFLATWGLYGMDAMSFTMPTGIAVAPDGRVVVADGDAHRIMIFPPLE
jgi:DNA-binding beta-propeller fold protein YncE